MMDIQDYIKLPYSRVLIPEDVGYSGSVLEFPGCLSGGETTDETMMNLDNAMLAWIDAALSVGQDIPSPFILSDSYQVIVNLSPGIYRSLVKYRKPSESTEQFVTEIIVSFLSQCKKIDSIPDFYQPLADYLSNSLRQDTDD